MIGSYGGLSFLMLIVIIGFYIFLGVVIWRFMTAHESIAESLKIIALNLKKEP